MSVTTFLLDLDDTLLGNSMSKFLPAYFATLQKRLSQTIKGKELQQEMIASAQVVQANQDPTLTNLDVFITDFAQRVDTNVEEVRALLTDFYQKDYPHLQQYTTFRPEAPQVVDYLLTANYSVVIATNPLFPATAIEQRLAWAGIDGRPYALVTTMENSHFSKPNPRYYQEILTKIGSQAQATWMVGDDPENDIEPAGQLGLKTWWVTTPHQSPAATATTPNKQGSLAQFLTWLKQGCP